MARPATSGDRCGWPNIKSLIYISDLSTGLCLLIDTGAEISTVPPTLADLWRGQAGLTLQAVNSTSIPLTVHILSRRSFQWLFITADVKKAILGVDFLQHY